MRSQACTQSTELRPPAIRAGPSNPPGLIEDVVLGHGPRAGRSIRDEITTLVGSGLAKDKAPRPGLQGGALRSVKVVAGVAPIFTDSINFFSALPRSYNTPADCKFYSSLACRRPVTRPLPRRNTDPREISGHPPRGVARAVLAQSNPPSRSHKQQCRPACPWRAVRWPRGSSAAIRLEACYDLARAEGQTQWIRQSPSQEGRPTTVSSGGR